jgi:hypothetical protein
VLSYTDKNDLTVGIVGATTGINTRGNDLTLNTGDTLTLAQGVKANGAKVSLDAAKGGVSQTGGAITADGLELTGKGTFDLTSANNNVNTLAADVNGVLSYTDKNALTVGIVGATTGINTRGNDLTLNTGDTLTLTQDVKANGAKVSLDAAKGGVSQTGGAITADGLELTGKGTFDLTSANNNVNTLAADIDGRLDYKDKNDLTIGIVGLTTGINSTDHKVKIKAGDSLMVNNDIDAGTSSVDLTATNGTILGQPTSTVKGDSVTLKAATGIGSTPTALNTQTKALDAQVTGSGDMNIANTQASPVTADLAVLGTGNIQMAHTGGGALTVNSAQTNDGAIAITAAGGDLAADNVVAGGDHDVTLTTTTSGDITVGAVTAAGNTVNVNAAGDIIDDAVESAVLTGDTVNLTAGGKVGGPGLLPDEDIDTDASHINVNAGGDIYLENAGGGDFAVNSTGGSAVVLAHGTSTLKDSTVLNDFTFESTVGDILFDGTTTAVTGAVRIQADNGDMRALSAGPHVVAAKDSFLGTPNGIMGERDKPIDVKINATLTLDIGKAVDRFSGALSGSVVNPLSDNIPTFKPVSFPVPLIPPGKVFFNNVMIWPKLSTFAASQASNALNPGFLFPTAERLAQRQVSPVDVTSSYLVGPVYSYHPLTDVDSGAYDGIDLGEDVYEFIDGRIEQCQDANGNPVPCNKTNS